MDNLFYCECCGSSAVMLPRELRAASDVTCACCGNLIGTLGELRARAERLTPAGRFNGDAAAHSLLARL